MTANDSETPRRIREEAIRGWIITICVCIGTGIGIWQLIRIDCNLQQLQFQNKRVLSDAAVLSRDLWERGYMLDTFGGNAKADVQDKTDVANGNLSEGILQLYCERRLPPAGTKHGAVFAGVNIFGNEFVQGKFKPIFLDRGKVLRLRFRYPENGSLFYIKLKNGDHYETAEIPIQSTAGVQGDEFQIFDLRMDDSNLDAIFSNSDTGKFLTNIAIMTTFSAETSDATIELSEFQYNLPENLKGNERDS